MKTGHALLAVLSIFLLVALATVVSAGEEPVPAAKAVEKAESGPQKKSHSVGQEIKEDAEKVGAGVKKGAEAIGKGMQKGAQDYKGGISE